MNGSLFRDPDGRQTVEPVVAGTPIEEEEERPTRTRFLLPLGLFLLTGFTTLWAGAYQTNSNPFQGPWQFLRQDPSILWKGVPFAATLLGILLVPVFFVLITRRRRDPNETETQHPIATIATEEPHA